MIKDWFNIAAESGHLGLWKLNLQTGKNEINEYWAGLLGYSKKDIDETFEFLLSLVHKDDRKKLLNSLENIKKGSTDSIEEEIRMIRKDGSYRWILKRGEVVKRDDKGTAIELTGIHLDITSKKKAELEEQSAHQFLAMAIEGSGSGIWSWNFKTNEITWDEHMYQLFKSSSKTHPDTIWKKYVFENDQVRVQEELNHCKKSHKPFDSVYRVSFANKTNQTRYLHSQARVYLNELGESERIIGLCHDITEEISAREKIDKAQRERNAILESISDGFFALDGDWRVTYWNNSAEELLRIKRNNILGMDLKTFISRKDIPDFLQELTDAKESFVSKTSEVYFSELSKWFQLSIFPKKDGLSVFIKDISELKYMNETILEKVLQSRVDEQDRIARNLHDGVVQDMAALTMNFNHLIHKHLDGEISDLFKNAVNNIKEVTDQIRNISHQLISGDIHEKTFEDLVRRLKNQLSLQNEIAFSFNIHLGDSIFEISDYVKLHLYRILQELTNNIIKHSKAEKAIINIEEIAGELFVSVTDDGIGMENENENMGIGLQNIKDRVRTLNGTIGIENNKIGGLTISFNVSLEIDKHIKID